MKTILDLVEAAPLWIVIAVVTATSAVGYTGVAINAIRRLRSGELRGLSASLPGFRFKWNVDLGVTNYGRPSEVSRLQALRRQARLSTHIASTS
jgi:hypothetical protein